VNGDRPLQRRAIHILTGVNESEESALFMIPEHAELHALDADSCNELLQEIDNHFLQRFYIAATALISVSLYQPTLTSVNTA